MSKRIAGTIRANCTRCGSGIEIEPDSDHATCAHCGTVYDTRELQGSIDLAEKEEPSLGEESRKEAATIIETRLAEIEESLDESRSEIDNLRARELSGPLQLGCAFFGVFGAILAVIVIFMLLGKSYFGSWIFFVFLAAVVSLGITRIRRKLNNRVPAEELRRERVQLEESLLELETEGHRLRKLRASLQPEGSASEDVPQA